MPFKRKLAANAAAHPADVAMAKIAMRNLGFYTAPDWGISEYPDRALFDAIRAFQHSEGVREDGAIEPGGETEAALEAMAHAVQAQGRNGDTVLAHITPEEAALLHHLTDGASINPKTGLLEFSFFDAISDFFGGSDTRDTKDGDEAPTTDSDDDPDFFANLAEDFSSLFSGKTSTGAPVGPDSAYDTRAAEGRVSEMGVDPKSPLGTKYVKEFLRGGGAWSRFKPI